MSSSLALRYVSIFAAFVILKKAKMSNAEFQPKSYNAFDIGVYLSAVKCLLIAAESSR